MSRFLQLTSKKSNRIGFQYFPMIDEASRPFEPMVQQFDIDQGTAK